MFVSVWNSNTLPSPQSFYPACSLDTQCTRMYGGSCGNAGRYVLMGRFGAPNGRTLTHTQTHTHTWVDGRLGRFKVVLSFG